MITIKDLRQDENQWTFVVIWTDYFGTQKTVECETNKFGNGLWQNGKQTDGTCQFSLSGVTRQTVIRRIKRRFTLE